MKITASKKDDLMKARQEYDAETNRLNEITEQHNREYRQALDADQKAIEKRVAEMIGSTSLDLTIKADPYPSMRSVLNTDETWEIEVTAHEHDHFNEKFALSWNWKIRLDKDGNLAKDSGSWSGLRAITPEQLADLEESVRILKILNNTDWSELLHAPKAKFEDYYNKEEGQALRERRANRPDFEGQILDERLEELVGTNVAVQLLPNDQYYRGRVGILVTGITDKFLKGYIFPWYKAEDGATADQIRDYVVEERRTSKKNIAKDHGELIEVDLG